MECVEVEVVVDIFKLVRAYSDIPKTHKLTNTN